MTASVPFAEMLAALFFHLFSGLAGCGGYRRCKVKYIDTHCVGLCVRPKHKSMKISRRHIMTIHDISLIILIIVGPGQKDYLGSHDVL